MCHDIVHLDLCRLKVYKPNHVLSSRWAKLAKSVKLIICYIWCYSVYILAFCGPKLARCIAGGLLTSVLCFEWRKLAQYTWFYVIVKTCCPIAAQRRAGFKLPLWCVAAHFISQNPISCRYVSLLKLPLMLWLWQATWLTSLDASGRVRICLVIIVFGRESLLG